jgi:hypothetical protein
MSVLLWPVSMYLSHRHRKLPVSPDAIGAVSVGGRYPSAIVATTTYQVWTERSFHFEPFDRGKHSPTTVHPKAVEAISRAGLIAAPKLKAHRTSLNLL